MHVKELWLFRTVPDFLSSQLITLLQFRSVRKRWLLVVFGYNSGYCSDVNVFYC